MLSRDLSAPGGRNAHFMLIPAPAGVFRRRPPRFSRESEHFSDSHFATEAAKSLFRGQSDWEYAGNWGSAGGPFPAPPRGRPGPKVRPFPLHFRPGRSGPARSGPARPGRPGLGGPEPPGEVCREKVFPRFSGGKYFFTKNIFHENISVVKRILLRFSAEN